MDFMTSSPGIRQDRNKSDETTIILPSQSFGTTTNQGRRILIYRGTVGSEVCRDVAHKQNRGRPNWSCDRSEPAAYQSAPTNARKRAWLSFRVQRSAAGGNLVRKLRVTNSRDRLWAAGLFGAALALRVPFRSALPYHWDGRGIHRQAEPPRPRYSSTPRPG